MWEFHCLELMDDYFNIHDICHWYTPQKTGRRIDPIVSVLLASKQDIYPFIFVALIISTPLEMVGWTPENSCKMLSTSLSLSVCLCNRTIFMDEQSFGLFIYCTKANPLPPSQIHTWTFRSTQITAHTDFSIIHYWFHGQPTTHANHFKFDDCHVN